MANSMILTIPVKPESVSELLGMLKKVLPDTRAYDGCQKVEVYSPEDEPGKVMLLEVWDSKAHQEKYFAWRVENGLMDALGPMLAGDPSVMWLNTHD